MRSGAAAFVKVITTSLFKYKSNKLITKEVNRKQPMLVDANRNTIHSDTWARSVQFEQTR